MQIPKPRPPTKWEKFAQSKGASSASSLTLLIRRKLPFTPWGHLPLFSAQCPLAPVCCKLPSPPLGTRASEGASDAHAALDGGPCGCQVCPPLSLCWLSQPPQASSRGSGASWYWRRAQGSGSGATGTSGRTMRTTFRFWRPRPPTVRLGCTALLQLRRARYTKHPALQALFPSTIEFRTGWLKSGEMSYWAGQIH